MSEKLSYAYKRKQKLAELQKRLDEKEAKLKYFKIGIGLLSGVLEICLYIPLIISIPIYSTLCLFSYPWFLDFSKVIEIIIDGSEFIIYYSGFICKPLIYLIESLKSFSDSMEEKY